MSGSRCLKPHNFGPPAHAQLHHFADASEGGYGMVTYLRLQNETGDDNKDGTTDGCLGVLVRIVLCFCL